jgi:hypothetical protein
MTLPEFLEALRGTPRDWQVDKKGCIRLKLQNCAACPITSIKKTGACRVFRAGKVLGLDSNTILEIANAADYESNHDPALRAALLAACGLPPESAQ